MKAGKRWTHPLNPDALEVHRSWNGGMTRDLAGRAFPEGTISHRGGIPLAAFNRPKLIGLYSPLPQMGKSTVATHLATKYGAIHRQFAKPLKDAGAHIIAAYTGEPYEVVRERFKTDAKDKCVDYAQTHDTYGHYHGKPTMRDVLKAVGQVMRRLNEDWWVVPAGREMDRATSLDVSFVVDDVRKPNEGNAVKTRGGVLWAIIDPSMSGKLMDPETDGLLGTTLEDLRQRFPFVLINDRSKGDDFLIKQADAAWTMTQRLPVQ